MEEKGSTRRGTQPHVLEHYSMTLLTEAPAISIPKLKKALPAGYFPSTKGCEHHWNAPFPHTGQFCTIVTIVPVLKASTIGVFF